MTQKIIAAHAGVDNLKAGELYEAKLDIVMGNDITAPVAIKEFFAAGFKKVYDREKVVIVLDHFTPNKDIRAAELCAAARSFARMQELKHFFDVGDMGIEHALLPEKGIVLPGDLIIGADSHTCTYGAVGAASTGVGSTDMAAGMATGVSWFKIPPAIKFNIVGSPPKWVSGKDVILHIIGLIGVEGALYKSMEFTGDGVKNLTMDDRFTICNMAVEAGAKNAVFPVDEVLIEYLSGRAARPYTAFEADPDAVYDAEYTLDLSALKLAVAAPSSPSNIKSPGELKNIEIDQVVIGSCTNGRLSDLRLAAEAMRGKKVAPNVRCIIIPATQQIYLDALREGIIETFVKAGAAVSTPTCGPCIGGHMGVLGRGERAVATTNRNFVGRMGHTDSEIYLAGPAVAGASAVEGHIAAPDSI